MRICSLQNSFLGGIFCLEYPRRRNEKVNCHLRLLGYSKQKIPPKKLFRPEKFNLSSGAQVKPCRSGLRTGWVTHREDHLVVLSFLRLLLFCLLCGVIVNSLLKSTSSIISASGFRKRKKQRTNMARCSSPQNYHSSGRNTELELCRL